MIIWLYPLEEMILHLKLSDMYLGSGHDVNSLENVVSSRFSNLFGKC